ncbi:hypothetical protein CL622_07765, partial [archaeon]|nr:hypothetical protein [archaeon]
NQSFSTSSLFFSFAQSIMTGVGTGIVIALIMAYILRKLYFPTISPLLLIACAFVTYTLAENIGGNGVLGVTAFGLIFGNIGIHKKRQLQTFTKTFTNFLKIIVFILLGLIVSIPLEVGFFIKSTVLFLIYLVVRYWAVGFSFRNFDVEKTERTFMTLITAKGMDTAVMALVIGSYLLEGTTFIISEGLKPALTTIFDLSFMFIIYSVLIATIVAINAKKLLRPEKEMATKELKQKVGPIGSDMYAA